MILSATQPCYLPWMGLYNKLINCDVMVFLDDVQFEKGSYTNRTKIKTRKGEKWLTIPLKTKGYKDKTIRQMEQVEDDHGYQHAMDIFNNYRYAPYFRKPNVVLNWDFMSVLMHNITTPCVDLGIRTPITSQSYIGIKGTKQDLIINLCKHYNADAFLFGAKGRDYVDVEYFKSQGIEPMFQDFECIEYPQQWGGGFVPGLSVVDALFNCGPEKTLDLIKGGYSVRA